MIAQKNAAEELHREFPRALRHVMLFSVGVADDIPVIRNAGLKPIGAQ